VDLRRGLEDAKGTYDQIPCLRSESTLVDMKGNTSGRRVGGRKKRVVRARLGSLVQSSVRTIDAKSFKSRLVPKGSDL
jgi:hypothetical protein